MPAGAPPAANRGRIGGRRLASPLQLHPAAAAAATGTWAYLEDDVTRRDPESFRVVVRARDVDGFVARYRQYVDGDRIFIFTRVPPPAGTAVRFRIYLATGDCVLRGDGMVLRSVPEGSTQAGGMELCFAASDEASRALVRSLRASRCDGVPVAVIEDERTTATELR